VLNFNRCASLDSKVDSGFVLAVGVGTVQEALLRDVFTIVVLKGVLCFGFA